MGPRDHTPLWGIRAQILDLRRVIDSCQVRLETLEERLRQLVGLRKCRYRGLDKDLRGDQLTLFGRQVDVVQRSQPFVVQK